MRRLFVRDLLPARAVLLDSNGQVHLLFVSKHGYHKLPGGGLEEGEDAAQALERELMEEVGCKAEVITELGTIEECREYPDGGLRQISYC
jgi:8-oxo-dGTP pyrophosphatase MutT (NUDIX family)